MQPSRTREYSDAVTTARSSMKHPSAIYCQKRLLEMWNATGKIEVLRSHLFGNNIDGNLEFDDALRFSR